MVLVYGLAVAPVVHAVVGHGGGRHGVARQHTHAHGPGDEAHSHGAGPGARASGDASGGAKKAHARAEQHDGTGHGEDSRPRAPEDGHGPDGHQHLTGSVEHLHAMVAAWAVVKPPRVRAVSWLADVLCGPSRAPGAAPRLTAMPQGP
ncbi:hypothetical protein [Myxococcus sp. RHSTA-1-4]|uniref:hypothetical protein n=1 Tax=Myxococcus sp. RHSTA-1-4 TaxID=2874601 RepID=UPI001CBA7B35|nr:hypothetical protein [Myxococcus sp. RHSTA-1-4]